MRHLSALAKMLSHPAPIDSRRLPAVGTFTHPPPHATRALSLRVRASEERSTLPRASSHREVRCCPWPSLARSPRAQRCRPRAAAQARRPGAGGVGGGAPHLTPAISLTIDSARAPVRLLRERRGTADPIGRRGAVARSGRGVRHAPPRRCALCVCNSVRPRRTCRERCPIAHWCRGLSDRRGAAPGPRPPESRPPPRQNSMRVAAFPFPRENPSCIL